MNLTLAMGYAPGDEGFRTLPISTVKVDRWLIGVASITVTVLLSASTVTTSPAPGDVAADASQSAGKVKE